MCCCIVMNSIRIVQHYFNLPNNLMIAMNYISQYAIKYLYYYYRYYYDVTKFSFNNSLPHSVCHIISITIDNRDDPIVVIVFKITSNIERMSITK